MNNHEYPCNHMTNKKCVVCQGAVEMTRFPLGGLIFNQLEDHPAVCERCVFEKLTGTRLDWSRETKELMERYGYRTD